MKDAAVRRLATDACAGAILFAAIFHMINFSTDLAERFEGVNSPEAGNALAAEVLGFMMELEDGARRDGPLQ